jgi:tight adherence protein C
MPLIISALAFVLALTLLLGLAAYLHLMQFRQEWTARVEGRSATGWAGEIKERMGSFKTDVLGLMGQVGAATSTDEKAVSRLRRSLIMAGYRNAIAPYVFSAVRLLLALVLPLTLLILRSGSMRLQSPFVTIMMYLGLAMIGYYLPTQWLRTRIKGRQRRLTAGFPDALDLIVICVEAGLGLGPAIQRVGQELQMPHPELSEEFHLLSVELRTGMPRPQALRNFANRTGLEDVKTLVAILIQTDRFGTSIGDALRVHSDSMRKTRQFRAEELAAKLPVKMLFPLIFFIFPSFFVVILGPALLRIIRFMLPALGGH